MSEWAFHDDTLFVLDIYNSGGYGKIGSNEALNTLLINIEADKLPPQIYFASDESVSACLTKSAEVKRL
jgi:hypothetical protein